jgi:hypothetical protein
LDYKKVILKYVIEREIEVTGRRGKICKQLLEDLKGPRKYWKLKEEAQDCTAWRTCCGRVHGLFVRQTTF